MKKEHYVPQCYLERFCDNRGRLFVFDKVSGKVRGANKKDVAEERYFYDIPTELFPEDALGAIDNQFIEKWFASIEGKFKQLITTLIDRAETGGLSSEDRKLMAGFIGLQLFRTSGVPRGLRSNL